MKKIQKSKTKTSLVSLRERWGDVAKWQTFWEEIAEFGRARYAAGRHNGRSKRNSALK